MDCRSTHTSVCRPRPRRRCRFCTRVGFSLDYPLPSRFARRGARTASLGTRATLARRTGPSLSDVSPRPSVQELARSRAHESRAATRSIHAGDRLGCGDARRIRDDVGEVRSCRRRATRPLFGSRPAIDVARAISRRRRHATRRPPPTRAQRDRGFRVRAFGDERALALALPYPL